MEIWVQSRTKAEDYTWRTCAKCSQFTPPSSITEGYDQWKFEDGVPWFGLVSSQGVATLFFGNLMANREDSRNRPIFVHAALQAKSDDDVRELHGIVASLLIGEKKLLPKWTAYFLAVFDGGDAGPFPFTTQCSGTSYNQESIGRFVCPREDFAERERISRILCSSEKLNDSLVVGTTGRSGKGIFERVCNSQSKWQVAFFSSSCSSKTELSVIEEPLPGGVLDTRVVAVAIGGIILIATAIGLAFILSHLVGDSGTGSRNGGGGKLPASTNSIGRAIGDGEGTTNAVPLGGETDGETR